MKKKSEQKEKVFTIKELKKISNSKSFQNYWNERFRMQDYEYMCEIEHQCFMEFLKLKEKGVKNNEFLQR